MEGIIYLESDKCLVVERSEQSPIEVIVQQLQQLGV
jgi:hypothetical protein